MAWPAIAMAAAAVAGGIAGGQKKKSGGWNEGSQGSWLEMLNIDELNRGRSDLEATTDTANLDQFKSLMELVSRGPGSAEVDANSAWQNQFAQGLQSMLNGPTGEQVGQAQTFASQMFNPQRVAMQQAFQDQEVASNRLAARLGRAGNDPILRNKLAQEQTRQSAQLEANQGAFAAQYAQQLPQQYLQMGGALSNLRNGLATQAFANRQALLGLGQQLTAAERQYRISTAKRFGNSYNTGEQWNGGGTAGAINGAIAGAGSMMGAFGGGGLAGGVGGAGGGGTSGGGAGMPMISGFME